jgi:flavin-dependent dehydrogenase
MMPSIRERLSAVAVTFTILRRGSSTLDPKRISRHAYDGALLVGDAAGFINPLTGGGIHNGITSAILAAETIDEALKQGDVSRETLAGL